MAGNPRKFSEKIAIQQRKLNEETNAFESIIAEVTRITRAEDHVSDAPNLCPPGGWPRTGGSLPNVCHLSQQPEMMMPGDNHMAVYTGHWPGSSVSPGNVRVTMVHPRERSPGATGHGHHTHTYHPYRSVSPQNISPRTVSPSHQMMPDIRQQVPQPCGGPHSYLVPPQDGTWRRTHSDPGIHASVMQPTMPFVNQPGYMSTMPTPSFGAGSSSSHNSPRGDTFQDFMANACYLDPKNSVNPTHVRPRSCENMPNTPNINLQPSEALTAPQIPISNNTGSLPDLPSSLLPGLNQSQKTEDLIRSQPPPSYSHVSVYAANSQPVSAGPAPIANVLQQRHSIQFPVQYPQGDAQKYSYGSNLCNQNLASHHQTYQPESPRSTSGSPNDTVLMTPQMESPVTSPHCAQPQSPGSPYYSIQTKMQNINIDSQSPNTFNKQQQGYYGESYYPTSIPYQQHQNMNTGAMSQMQMTQQEQAYQAMMQHQQYNHQANTGFYQQHIGHQIPPLSPQGGQIPNIIFTGIDGSVSGGGSGRNVNGGGLYVDHDVELLSSDLRLSLDPIDLETLHGLVNEQGLHIDAASEDELRRDRM